MLWAGRDGLPANLQRISDDILNGLDGLVVRTYTQVDAALLDRTARLRVVGRAGVGLDNVDLDECQRRSIAVVFTPDANSQAVVEYVLALIMDDLRPRVALSGTSATDPEHFHHLRRTAVGRQLDRLTVGIIGFGRIGKRLGRVIHALGVRLLVRDLLSEQELRTGVDYPFEYVGHDDLLRQSDIVSLHVDGRAENRHMVGSEALSHLKPEALLINTARGMLIDAQALRRWLLEHQEQGARAVLDVHDPEPLSDGYPLLGLPNVRLLPHLASRTHQALENMSWVVRDVVAVLDGATSRFPAGRWQ